MGRVVFVGFALLSALAGCGALLGVDFDNAHPALDASVADEAAADVADASQAMDVPDATGVVGAAAKLLQRPEALPRVAYRAVHAISRSHVLIAGDETIVELVGGRFQITHVNGVELTGVWGDDEVGYAVGTYKGTNTGTIRMRRRSATAWTDLGSLQHGLRAVWGSGTFRVASGNDGAVYYGHEPDPFVTGMQLSPLPGVPSTIFSPILSGIGGNSPDLVLVAAGAGGWYRFDGTNWLKGVLSGDLTRVYRSVWGRPGTALDVFIGGNYELVMRFPNFDAGVDADYDAASAELFHEERDDVTSGSRFVNSIWGESGAAIVAVGTTGRFMVSKGRGLETYPTVAGSRDLWGVSGTSFDDVWIVGDDGVILHGPVDRP